MYCCIVVLVSIVIHDNLLYITKEHSIQQLLQCRSQGKFKTTLLMKIQNEKLLQMMEFPNILINLEEPIGYPAHTGLISLSVCPFVRPSGIQKNIHFERRN
jgi:hypothetical protein